MKPGEVYRFWSGTAGKQKFHLCISTGGAFLFLNSPKTRSYDGDLEVDGALFPFLPTTPSGKTVVSCTTVTVMTESALARMKAELLGTADKAVLHSLCEFVEDADFLTEAERELILAGIDDWL